MKKLVAIALCGLLVSGQAFAGSYAPLVLKSGQPQQAQAGDTVKLPNIASGTQCVHADSSGNLTGTGADCGSGTGTVTTTGSPATGNLAKFTGAASVSNADLTGDVTTSGGVATTLATVNANVGSFGDSTHCISITTNAKGLITAASQATCAPAFSSLTGAATLAQLPSTAKVRSFGTTFGDTTGSALTSGSVVYFTVPYACTISAWNITVDAGTVTFDIWKIASGTAIPTVTNTITASAKPALATGTALHSTSMSGWTTSVTANDIFGIQLNTVATAKYAEIDVECDQ